MNFLNISSHKFEFSEEYSKVASLYRAFFSEKISKKRDNIQREVGLYDCLDDDDDDDDDDCFNEEDETIDKNYKSTHNWVRNKKLKVKLISKSNPPSIFTRLENFDNEFENDDVKLQKNDYMYACDYSWIIRKLNSSMSSESLAFNYPGGYMIPNKTKCFVETTGYSKLIFCKNEEPIVSIKRRLSDDTPCVINKQRRLSLSYEPPVYKNKDPHVNVPLDIHVCDFNSLYPNEMIKENICTSTVCYNPNFAIRIIQKNGNILFVSPFDKKYINVTVAPIKINKTFLYVLAFVTKPDIQTSITSGYLMKLNSERKRIKQLMSHALKVNNIVDYYVHNNKQGAVKVVTNSMYGISNDLFKSSFKPVIASLVTRSARNSLVRLYLHFLNFFRKNRIPMDKRQVLYGDTDSCFLVAAKHEILAIIQSFGLYSYHRNVLRIELEKTAIKGLFLAKKSYILLCQDNTLYAKQVFTKSKSLPSKTFLSEIICLIVHTLLDGHDISSEIEQIYLKFFKNPDTIFRNSITMSKDLKDYKSSTQPIIQLKHLSSHFNMQFLRGSKISSSHYNFIFTPGACYGPVDVNNVSQMNFLNNTKNNTCTLLVDDMLFLYKDIFEKFNCHVNKQRVLDLDVRVVLNKVLSCIEYYSHELYSIISLKMCEIRARGSQPSKYVPVSSTDTNCCTKLVEFKKRKLSEHQNSIQQDISKFFKKISK